MKSIHVFSRVFLLVLFVALFSFAPSVNALTLTIDTDEKTETTSVQTEQEETASRIPGFIRKPFEKAYAFSENLRLEWKESISKKQIELKARIEAQEKAVEKDLKTREEADPETYKKTTYVDSTHGNAIERALLTLLLFVYTALIFIVTNVFVFYGAIALVIILILRFIWNHLL